MHNSCDMAPYPVLLPDLDSVVGGAKRPDPSCESLQGEFASNYAKRGPEYFFARWGYLRHARWNLHDAKRLGCEWSANVPMP